MMKIDVHVISYLFIVSALSFVNNQYMDGMIKLKQGSIIGVRNIKYGFGCFVLVWNEQMFDCFIS